MSKRDEETTLQELKDLVAKFDTERHWEKHHAPKNLAMNIAIEAAELMEHYVWDRAGEPERQEVADELADVFFNVLNFAHTQDIDLAEAFMSKFKRLEVKYPVEKFNKDRDDLNEYRKIKQAYRAGKGAA